MHEHVIKKSLIILDQFISIRASMMHFDKEEVDDGTQKTTDVGQDPRDPEEVVKECEGGSAIEVSCQGQ